MTLYHNDGHGHFTDVSKRAGVETPPEYYGFTVLTGDFDNDGWPDFFVSCDSTASLYFHNNRNGTFEEMGVASGLAYNEDGREQAGMGATAADYDHDGRLDISKPIFRATAIRFITTMAMERSRMRPVEPGWPCIRRM